MFVHAGNVELDYGDQTFTLGPGDSAYFDASVGHKIRAVGDERAEVVVVAHARRPEPTLIGVRISKTDLTAA